MHTPTVSQPQTKADHGTWQRDIVASIVVFLVALPLCIGIAVAVGVSPARALITGIIGGLVVGYLAGSPLQVSGPAAGLFVIIADILATQREKYLATITGPIDQAAESAAVHYSLVALGAAVFLAGILQIVAGRLRLGQWFRAVSPAVIRGMLAGIGVLILLSQFHVMLDHQALWHGKPAHGGWQYLATIPDALWKCFVSTQGNVHHLAAAIGVITIATILGWQAFASKRLQLIPAALVGVVLASAVAVITDFPISKLIVPDNLMSEITLTSLQSLVVLQDADVLWAAIVIALVASAETLLCATAVDKMAEGHRTDYDRELSAQGVGNALCGLVGALPMTGVIVRSSANVHAGAKTRRSAMLHGLWLLLFVVLLPGILAYIPRAALGALLVYTGAKLVNIKQVKELWQVGKGEVAVYLVTLILIVSYDLLIGVVAGVLVSAVRLLVRFSHLEVELDSDPESRRAWLHLRGAATFLRLPTLAAKLDDVPDNAELHVELHELNYIDHACFELLIDWAKQHERTGGALCVDWEMLHGKFREEDGTRKTPPTPKYLSNPVDRRLLSPNSVTAN